MLLRLFERLSRLVGWLSGTQGAGKGTGTGTGRPRDFRSAGPDAGRHRRSGSRAPSSADSPSYESPSAGAPRNGAPRNGAPRAGSSARAETPAMQPPAALPQRTKPLGGRLPRPTAPRASEAAPPPRNYTPVAGGGIGRARIREAPFDAAPAPAAAAAAPPVPAAPVRAAARQPWYQVVGGPAARRGAAGSSATAATAATAASARDGRLRPPAQQQQQQQQSLAQQSQAQAQAAAALRSASPAAGAAAVPPARQAIPFTAPHPRGYPLTADGRRNCGPLESILWRQWDAASAAPPPQVIAAIDRLAEFPRALQEKLATGLDGIYVGAGGVPDLDHMAALHGVVLPSGKATWDACAGAYGEHKIVVGTRPSPTPDVMCHEVGHALDDLDSPPGKWQSDSAEFRLIYDQCQPYIASDFHRQRGGLGRKEFFADSFASIASAQRPALVDMLGGNTRIALRVMLYFNRRYGI
jgi:hypothetical protein